MRRHFVLLALFLFSLNSYAVPARIMYFQMVGEYVSEKPYEVDVDFAKDSIKTIKNRLISERVNNPHFHSDDSNCSEEIDSNLVVIAYGGAAASNYFAATKNVNHESSLQEVLQSMTPPVQDEKMWYFVFIAKSLSHYVTSETRLEWFSPLSKLATIGHRKLKYF